VFPALVLVIGAQADSALALRGGPLSVFLGERAAFESGDGGELSEEGLALA
jgi:hypothetical protein